MKMLANGMPFINDEYVIGKWEFFDTIRNDSEFDDSVPGTFLPERDFKEIYFLPGGEKYWIFEGWTKGYLLIHYGGDAPILCYKYQLEDKNGNTFMFLETEQNEEHDIFVMKKVSNKAFCLEEIGRRDNIDLPFKTDSRILGEWISVDFIDDADMAVKPKPQEELWLKSIRFFPDGIAIRKYDNEEWRDKWTAGFLLDLKKSTASRYFFKIIEGEEYIFLEWKMGNYVYGGAKPSYYVFTKDARNITGE